MIPIEVTDLKATTFVPPSSRYANSNVLKYGEEGVLTFETYKRQSSLTNPNDQFTIVTPGEQYRPDKTSFKAYGTVDFWWAIMEANQIKDIFDYVAGLNIRIPSFITIFRTNG